MSEIAINRYKETSVEEYIYNAAFQLAMSSEYLLKALLEGKSIDYTHTHSHKMLITECGKAGIKIPSEIRSIASILKSYQDCTRYNSDYIVYQDELEDCFNIVKKYINLLSTNVDIKSLEVIDRINKLI